MALWKLELHEAYVAWDITVAFIIRAKNEDIARRIARDNSSRDGDPNDWINVGMSSCEKIPITGKNEVILEDFNAG